MHKQKIIIGIIFVAMIVVILCSVILYQIAHFGETTISFLNVGQGDAILISDGTYQILIDGGPDTRTLLEALGQQIPFWDRTIDVVIATHPDSDHIDGLIGVFDAYHVGEFWHTGLRKDTHVFDALMLRVKRTGTRERIVTAGSRATLPSGGIMSVIYPYTQDIVTELSDDANDVSIGATFIIGNEMFFFGGDLPQKIEETLALTERVSVLKAGHHGSNTSTSEAFLTQIKPRDVIFSVGANNRYGHPHERVLKDVVRSGAQIYRTDTDGTLIYTCTIDACLLSFDQW